MTKRRDIIKWSGLGLAAVAAAAPPKSSPIPNAVIDRSQTRLNRQKFGEFRTYFNGSTDQLQSAVAGSLLLKPGESPHPPHAHKDEEFMMIAEGTGEIMLEGQVTKVGPGSMMYSAAGKIHGIVNTGEAPLLCYFYKWQV